MAVAIESAGLMTDGDAAFLRVNNRKPAHALQPGEVAAATNCRFEQGKPRPRFGVASDDWGNLNRNLIPAGASYTDSLQRYTSGSILTVDESYTFTNNSGATINVTILATTTPVQSLGAVVNGDSVTFVAAGDVLQLYSVTQMGLPVIGCRLTGEEVERHTLAYERFNDPVSGTDNGILITDEWRTADTGRGRAWRIYPGNGPQEIPLNGHDVWDRCTLVQCRGELVLFREGDERHYFAASNLTALTDEITLNCAPSWAVGTSERVQFNLATEGAAIYGQSQNITDTDLAANTITVIGHGLTNGTAKRMTALSGAPAGTYFVRSASVDTLTLHPTYADAVAGTATVNLTADNETGTLYDAPPAAGNYYYARHFSGNKVKLYQSSADAAADTNWITFSTVTTPVGKFYLQLARSPKPFFGDGAPNLIMQGDDAGTPGFEIGFVALPENVAITNTTATVIDAANHGLVPGDAVTTTGITVGTGGPHYAFPLTAHTFTLHTSATNALTGASAINTITPGGSGSFKKTNASGLPLPSCRTGAYVNGRLFGVNGRDTIVFSDVNDPLHCTLYQSTLPANQGEAGRVNWILPLGEDAIIIGKDLKLLVLAGVANDTSGWTEGTITGEYGGIAPLAADNVGTDAWFLSRKGVASVVRTVAGEKLGVAKTISQDIPMDLLDVDWAQAYRGCAAVWNNRYFVSLPTKGQTTVVNNRTLVLNFLNASLTVAQDTVAGDVAGGIQETGGAVDSWEGRWEGELLTPFAFARVTVAGDERLTFATPDGLVCWLHDGFDDAGEQIESSITTRGYFGGREVLALRGKINWESFNPKVTANILTAGVNEEETLAGFDELEYDRTQYLTDGQADYDPDTSTQEQYDAPDREDYSTSAAELFVGQLDLHQHLSEPFRCRVRGSAPQIKITNTQGSLRVESVSLQAKPVGIAATRKT